ncbi:MAG TPA: epoxyqueuosine reductase QueH [Bacilli bacterium]|nr:epoxyqueuosine reductase QueH [Bacilli bacterium]
MKLLLHICCAPCSIYPIKILKKDYDITGFWYNINIHPYIEYKNRLECLKEYANKIGLDMIYKDKYDVKEFINNIDINDRCTYCYRKRLEETVKYAKDNNYDSFSTTLLVSKYQKHELIKDICEKLAKEYDIKFIYKDFREYFRQGQEEAREEKLYMQKYCGCIFSEAERYTK